MGIECVEVRASSRLGEVYLKISDATRKEESSFAARKFTTR